MNTYNLEKWIWSDKDFDDMGWHDCPIYAFKFDDNVCFDLDYIFKWNDPDIKGMPYTFWISPATMIFEDISLFKVNFTMDFVNGLEICEISKSIFEDTSEWIIETQEGTIIIHAKSYKQIIRRKPSLQYGQSIDEEERGEDHFGTSPEKNYVEPLQVQEKKRQEHELYQLAVKRLSLKRELKSKSSLDVGTKEFLLFKRALNDEINQINKKLYGTRFESY